LCPLQVIFPAWETKSLMFCMVFVLVVAALAAMRFAEEHVA
jgi:hypothetical protein